MAMPENLLDEINKCRNHGGVDAYTQDVLARCYRIIAALDPTHKRWSEVRFFNARTTNIICRKDAVEYPYEGDFLKDVARLLVPRYGGMPVCTDDTLPEGVIRLEQPPR